MVVCYREVVRDLPGFDLLPDAILFSSVRVRFGSDGQGYEACGVAELVLDGCTVGAVAYVVEGVGVVAFLDPHACGTIGAEGYGLIEAVMRDQEGASGVQEGSDLSGDRAIVYFGI